MSRAIPLTVILALLLGAPLFAQDAPKPLTLPLWPEGKAPNGDGTFDPSKRATITLHRPANPNGAAAVICPGGGYGGVVIGPEGHGIAKWLNQHGVTGIVLRYRLPKGRSSVPLLDAQRALRTVRSRAAEWKCAPNRLGIIGFSAGGHLASTAATHFDPGIRDADDPIERLSSRPDFTILVYPVITMGEKTHGGSKRNLLGKAPTEDLVTLYSNEKQVTAKTCPSYLAHAKDDRLVVPANSELFYQALQKHEVKSVYLELPSGGHGLNGYKGPMWDAWQNGSLKWLEQLKILPAK